MPRRRKNRNAGVGARDRQLDPALLLVEWLVGGDLHADRFRPKMQRRVLVGHGYSDKLDASNHARFLLDFRSIPTPSRRGNRLFLAIVMSGIDRDSDRRLCDRRADARSGGPRPAPGELRRLFMAGGGGGGDPA